MTSRPLYVPHLGQAWWGSLGLLHCGQKLAVSTLSLCWARRESKNDQLIGAFCFRRATPEPSPAAPPGGK